MNEFTELINKQVVCYTKNNGTLQLDKKLLGLLTIMYPNYRVIYSEFDIYYGEPFIYAGDPKWIPKINKHPEPHICLATTGDYDLTDKQVLVDLAYLKHNKKQPQYLKELIESWDDQTFYYNWKYLWLLGTIPDKEINDNKLFLNIIQNLSNPLNIPSVFLQAAKDEESVKYLENMLISFILKSKDMNAQNTKNMKMFMIRRQFYASYHKNIPTAVHNLITSNIKSKRLSTLNFLMDLTLNIHIVN